MSCQRKFSPQCLNDDCNEFIETRCKSYKPFPPRMTDEQFQVKQAEILEDIPEELRGALSHMAYESGHSSGNEEMIIHLQNYVSALEEPLKNLIKRLTNNP